MSTSFGNEHFVSVLQAAQRAHSIYGNIQESLVACHENGKGGQRDIVRRIRRYPFKSLTVGYDHPRFLAQMLQRLFKSRFLDDDGRPVCIEYIPYGLLLGQDQPSFGSR